MVRLEQRFPLYVRPLPFLSLVVAGCWAIRAGLPWSWDWSLQTGNVFILLRVPDPILPLWGPDALFVWGGVACLGAAFAWGTRGEPGAQRMVDEDRGWWTRPAFRFFPATFALGLFLVYFGLVFLFDASVYGDDAPGGYAAFVYLDYAGLLDRPFVTGVGLAIAAAGLACILFAFRSGTRLIPVRRLPQARLEASTAYPSPISIDLRPAPPARMVRRGHGRVTAPARAMAPHAPARVPTDAATAAPRRALAAPRRLTDEDLE